MRFPASPAPWRPLLAALVCLTTPTLRAQSPSPALPSAVPGGKFPIGVWLQGSRNAARYQAAGINVFVGLSDGVTAASLDALAKADLRLIIEQTPATLAFKNSPVITGWMHGDEPDNAQSIPEAQGGGYGPPIAPEKIVAEYQQMKQSDPTRPVLLNLGMGVAWDGWFGRGVRTNHPEDYPRYVQGADIASFDIYPVTFEKPAVAGKLEYVPQGVARLVQWAGPGRTVWNCIECTHIGNAKTKPTPAQVRSEVWMSLIKGSRGLIYFVHQFAPSFVEPALLVDPEMTAAVTAINAQIQELAPVLLSPTRENAAWQNASADHSPLATMTKIHGGNLYLFAANMTNAPQSGSFSFSGIAPAEAEVIGETRQLASVGGKILDAFDPYAVHIYKVGGR